MLPVQLLRKNKHSFLLMLWMAVMPLLCSALITVVALKYEASIRAFTTLHWLLFFSGTAFSMAMALTPTTFIALISGYFLGWQAVPYMLVAYLTASGIGYYLARYVDQGKFFQTLKQAPKVDRFIAGINQKQFSFIILCRISPVLPFAIMNVVLSMMQVSFSRFLWAGFIGMLPRTLLFIWVGSTASVLKEVIEGGQKDAGQLSFLILLIISIVGFYLYFKQVISRRLSGEQ